MVDLTEISAVVAAAGVLVGVVNYILEIRYNMKAREMELCQLVTSDSASEQGIRRYATMMNMEWKDYEDSAREASHSLFLAR